MTAGAHRSADGHQRRDLPVDGTPTARSLSLSADVRVVAPWTGWPAWLLPGCRGVKFVRVTCIRVALSDIQLQLSRDDPHPAPRAIERPVLELVGLPGVSRSRRDEAGSVNWTAE